jgi:hypothetical protein
MPLRVVICSHDCETQFEGHIHTGRPGTPKIQFHPEQIVERITTAEDELHNSIKTPFQPVIGKIAEDRPRLRFSGHWLGCGHLAPSWTGSSLPGEDHPGVVPPPVPYPRAHGQLQGLVVERAARGRTAHASSAARGGMRGDAAGFLG